MQTDPCVRSLMTGDPKRRSLAVEARVSIKGHRLIRSLPSELFKDSVFAWEKPRRKQNSQYSAKSVLGAEWGQALASRISELLFPLMEPLFPR